MPATDKHIPRTGLVLAGPLALAGCGGVLDPAGPVAAAERLILFNAAGIMLVVVLPVIAMTLGFAWWYRAGNKRAKYSPAWAYSGQIEMVVWSIPVMVVILLAGVGWLGAHQLDPRRPIETEAEPMTVQVVSLDWKWLFIYPDQRLATVNELVVPAGVPIAFQLTSATVMNAFFIPRLGSMIYTMPGMTSKLNLMAGQPGEYPGMSAHYSGAGFSDMRFIARALPRAEFDRWAILTRDHAPALDEPALAALARKGTAIPAQFGKVETNLFDRIVEDSTRPPGPRGPGPPN